MKKVNSTMVARLAGVSQSTVSLVANNSMTVADETRRRVIEAARQLGYPLEARNRRKTIGIIIARRPTLMSYRMMMLAALLEEAPGRNYRTEVVCTDEVELLNDRIIAGAIDISIDGSLNRRWRELGNPPLVRIFGKGAPAENICSVHPDSRWNMALAVNHLKELGHCRIGALIYHPESWENNSSLERNGAELIAQFAAMGLDPELVLFNVKQDLPERLDFLLERRVTALAVIPGDLGLRVCAELMRRGIRIPEELSVVTLETGFPGEEWNPPLTTLSRDYRGLASMAFELLDRLVSGERLAGDFAHPGQLRVRASTAPPPGGAAQRKLF